ncbi:MAG: hypothetical protein HN899_12295 [Gemmatimonadales bacterium]|jgi:hypothetical protein|nr:hypothetical protein [Gemmatimonadales bacterium]MBT4189442.1 hypothetical protein [Gemmatimonadales bacterium]MBT7125935.1 hypothetical protein [Gemmatimonadales bacterium]
MMKIRQAALLLFVAFLGACGGPPAPGDSGYPYNVEGAYSGTLGVDGQGFAVEASIITEGGGIVSGVFRVTQPVEIVGVIEGTLLGDQLDIMIDYRNNPMTGCDGTVGGVATVSEGGGVLTGSMMITDCTDQLSGDMRLTRGS